MNNIKEYAKYLETWLSKTVKSAGAKGVIFGLSGGIDSAVLAGLAKKTFKNNYLAVIMHINNSALDQKCTNQLIASLKLNYTDLKLDSTVKQLTKALNLNQKNDADIIGNIKARIRMLSLYAFAQKHNFLVCGTSNYDEWQTGYFTKYGDSACDIAPLRNSLKSDVYELAQYYKIPQIVIERKPTASLKPKQTDEAELQLTYTNLDNFFKGLKSLSKLDLNRYKHLHHNSQHKRQLPHAPQPRWKLQ